jgi:hypothetical protein
MEKTMSKERELLKRVHKSCGSWINAKLRLEIEETLSQQDRKEVLLKAAYDLLKECDKGIYVKNALETVVFYDDAECDGTCLMEDIAIELGIDEFA